MPTTRILSAVRGYRSVKSTSTTTCTTSRRPPGPWAADGYSYSWGAGHLSASYAENNAIMLGSTVDPADIVYNWGGTAMTEKDTWIGQNGRFAPASALAAFNAVNTATIGPDTAWTRALRTLVLPTVVVPVVVRLTAGTHLLG